MQERIEIQEFFSGQNENGFDVEDWKEYYKCWSTIRFVTGKEYISAKATNSTNIVTFTIRYCNKVKELLKANATEKYKIIYKGESYNINYTNDFNNLHQFIDIKGTRL